MIRKRRNVRLKAWEELYALLLTLKMDEGGNEAEKACLWKLEAAPSR
jgi:hypothetical protein